MDGDMDEIKVVRDKLRESTVDVETIKRKVAEVTLHLDKLSEAVVEIAKLAENAGTEWGEMNAALVSIKQVCRGLA